VRPFDDDLEFWSVTGPFLPRCVEKFVALLGAMRPQALMVANDFERAPVKVEVDGLEETRVVEQSATSLKPQNAQRETPSRRK